MTGNTRTLATAALAATTLLLVGCGGQPLAERDPHGYEACSLLSESRQAVDTRNMVNKRLQAGEAAAKASTESIRDSSSPLFDEDALEALEGTSSAGQNFALADVDQLAAACEGEGFDMPAESATEPRS